MSNESQLAAGTIVSFSTDLNTPAFTCPDDNGAPEPGPPHRPTVQVTE